MNHRRTLAIVAVTGLVVLPGTARVDAQGQAEQFTPEYRELRRSFDEKHTPKIEAPDTVKRGQWFEVTVTNLFDDPSVGGWVANLRDVTERRQAGAARRLDGGFEG